MGRLRTAFFMGIVLIATAGVAWSQGQRTPSAAPKMQCQDRFNALDKNRDGTVTHEEFMAMPHPGGRTEEVFKARDGNGDDSLTMDEFCARKGMGRKGGRP